MNSSDFHIKINFFVDFHVFLLNSYFFLEKSAFPEIAIGVMEYWCFWMQNSLKIIIFHKFCIFHTFSVKKAKITKIPLFSVNSAFGAPPGKTWL